MEIELLNRFPIILIGLLIIAYLLRPRPVNKTIPSLMFFMKKKKRRGLNAILGWLIRDPLFLLQLIILGLLCLSIASPVMTYMHDLSNDNTILVLDTSASVKAGDRFSRMIDEAKDDLSGDVSAVLIKSEPEIYFRDLSPSKAKDMLDQLEPTDSTSDIDASIREALRLLEKESGTVRVISDFVSTTELGEYYPEDIRMEYITLEPVDDNVGFVDYEYPDKLYIKNYGEKKNITIDEEITLDEGETREINIEPGKGKVSIEEEDPFMADNDFYVNLPEETRPEVLLLSNRKGRLYKLLESADYDVQFNEEPGDQDLIIVNDKVDEDEIKDYLKEGGAVITKEPILDIEHKGIIEGTPSITEHSIMEGLVIPKIKADHAELPRFRTMASIDGKSIIAYRDNLMYYGIEDRDFTLTASYPLFWKRSIDHLIKDKFHELNKKTDEYDETGFHGKLAVNILNEKESRVTESDTIESVDRERSEFTEKEELDLAPYLLYLAIFLMLIELIINKYRGDL